MVIGHLMRKHHYLNVEIIHTFKKIVMDFSLPSLVFLAFAQINFKTEYLMIILAVFTSYCLMLIAGISLKKALHSENPYFPTLYTTTEAGMIGYPLFITVYGASELYKLAIMDVGQALFTFIVLIGYIRRKNGNSVSVKLLFLGIIRTPLFAAIVFGILFSVTGLMGSIEEFPLSVALIETLKLISNLTVPLICIAIGYELRLDLKRIHKSLTVVLSRFLLLFTLAFLISTFVLEGLLQLDSTYTRALYLLFLMPITFIIPINMDGALEKDKQFVLNTISVSVILSLVAFLVLIVVFA